MKDNNFDWWLDGDVCVREQLPIAVSISDGGDVLIQQHNKAEYDGVVYILPGNVPALIAALQRAIGIDESGPKDRTAAERKRRQRGKDTVTDRDRERDAVTERTVTLFPNGNYCPSQKSLP